MSFHKNYRIDWTISEFSKRQEKPGESCDTEMISANFNDELINMFLRIYPRGLNMYCRNFVSLYLQIDQDSKPNVTVKYTFALLNAKNKILTRTPSSHCVQRRGYRKLISRKSILTMSKGILPEDELKISCEILIMSNIDPVLEENNMTVEELLEVCRLNKSFDVVKVHVSGKEFTVHRSILATHSKYFAKMFIKLYALYREGNTNCNGMLLKDVHPDTFTEIIRFVYTGKVLNIKNVVFDLLVAAHKYEINKLKVICDDTLRNQLCPQIAAITLVHAENCGLDRLKNETIDVILNNTDEVKYTAGWTVLQTEHPQLMREIIQKIAVMLNFLENPEPFVNVIQN